MGGLEIILPSLVQYGVGATIAGVLLWILHRILANFMVGLQEDRKNYMKIIESQTVHANNHIQHLDESIKAQSREIVSQKKQIEHGFDRTVEAIKSQTEILKAVVKNE